MTLTFALHVWMLVPALWAVAAIWLLVRMGDFDKEGFLSVGLVWLVTGGSAILARLLP